MIKHDTWIILGLSLILTAEIIHKCYREITFLKIEQQFKTDIEFWKNECISWKMALSECDESNKKLQNEIQKYMP